MAEVARYVDPKTNYIFTMTAAEAEAKGYKPFGGDQEQPEGAPAHVTDTDPPEYPKHIGGGTYELSDGSHVRGKDAATDAEAELRAEPVPFTAPEAAEEAEAEAEEDEEDEEDKDE